MYAELLNSGCAFVEMLHSNATYIRAVCLVSSINCVYFHRKYEEIYPPEVGEFVYITDDTYTKKQVRNKA